MKHEPLFLVAIVVITISFAQARGSAPGYYETSEYLIGDVRVEVIFLESNGTIDLNTENWTVTEEQNVMSEVTEGLSWLANQNPEANVSFWINPQYRVPTSYEPINHNHTEDQIWVSEAMTFLGYPGTDYLGQVWDYINALRNSSGADWAFAIFVIDSSNDSDGNFLDGRPAYAYLGGPFLVMTYDNGGWGISNMDRVCAHETGHIFWATDEYDGETEYSGYLNVSDVEGSGCLMDDNTLALSSGTWGQLGWRDTDGDGIQDIVDTFPDTTLIPYAPNPTYNRRLTFNGTTIDVPYPNQNPNGTGNSVTINSINGVWYSIDSGVWYPATPVDGAFDEAEEEFTFTTPELWGTHTIEVRGVNSVGNVEQTYAVDTVTIFLPSIYPGDQLGKVKTTFDQAEDVYVTGTEYIPNTEITIYIIPNGYEVTPINAKTVTRTTTSAEGAVSATLVWAYPLDLGNYDIWVDVNQNDVFDDSDVLKSQGIDVFAFNVIPEQITIASMLLLFGLLTALCASETKKGRVRETSPPIT